MGGFERFLKENKKLRENSVYAASRNFTDNDGNPVLWKIKPITTKENETLRDECLIEDKISGRFRLDISKYTAKLLDASVIEPNLYDKQLQDSYGVMTPEALIMELLDDPSEYRRFADHIRDLNGFGSGFSDKVNDAKN